MIFLFFQGCSLAAETSFLFFFSHPEVFIRIAVSFSLQSEKYGSEECWKDIFSFLVETMEAAVRSWHETSNVDAKVFYLLDKEKTDTEKYAPIVNIDKVLDVYCMLLHSIYSHMYCFLFRFLLRLD